MATKMVLEGATFHQADGFNDQKLHVDRDSDGWFVLETVRWRFKSPSELAVMLSKFCGDGAADAADPPQNWFPEADVPVARSGLKRVKKKTLPRGVTSYQNGAGVVRYRADIYRNGKSHALGTFGDVEDAAKAYNRAAKKMPIRRPRKPRAAA